MAGPGGSEHGRINIKVVPDTDGFTRDVEKLLKKYDKRNINMRVELDTRAAETKLKQLQKRYRNLKMRVDLDTRAAQTKLNKFAAQKRNKSLNMAVDLNLAGVEGKLAAVSRPRKAKVRAEADTTKASAEIDKAARDRKVSIRYRFVGAEAVKRLDDLDRKRVQKVNLDFDDKNLRTKLKALGRDNEILAEVEVDPKNVRDIQKWIRSLGKDFEEAGRELQKNFERIRKEQERLARAEAINRAALEAQRERERIARESERAIERERKAQARRRLEHERRINEQLRRGVQILTREYKKFNRALPVEIEIETDPRQRLIALRDEIDRLRRERVNIDVDVDYNRINRLLAILNMRDHRINVDVDVDRNRLGRVGRIFGSVFSGAGAVARTALAGVLRGISLAFSSLGSFGNLGQRVFGNLANSVGGATGKMGNLATIIGQVIASLLAIGVVVGILITVINTLGALIVAAIGAVAAIGSVVVGAAALLALPAIFAGVAAALVMMGDENDKVKKQFSELAQTIRSTVMTTAKPMVDLFSDSLEGLNRALRRGTPLYKELASGFAQSAKALEPLRSGMYAFAFQSLRGVNTALRNLNSSGSMNLFAEGIAGLGSVIGGFAANLSGYAPAFASGFTVLVAGLDRIQAALARWMGAFARFSTGPIDAFSAALTRLFDIFSTNARTFTVAADALGRAIADATPGIHKIATAFAQMAPGIFDAIAEAVNNLGDALDDPEVVQGLSDITSGMIKFLGVMAEWGTRITGLLGRFSLLRDGWEQLTGKISSGIDISTGEFRKIITQEKSARDRVNIGLRQLEASVGRHTGNIKSGLESYDSQLTRIVTSADTTVSSHVRGLAGRLQQLAQQWRDAGGRVGDDWVKAWQETAQKVDASGDQTLIGIKNKMNGLITNSEQFKNKMKANLIAALQAEGVNVDNSIIQKIDEQLGLLVNSSQTKSAQAIEAFQQNFGKLPGIIQEAMNEAKTPEQFQQKMEQINQIMAQMTPQIAASFAKLPTEMQKTLVQSQAAFQTWQGMEVFRQKVASGVQGAVQQFQQLGTTIGSLSGPMQGLNAQAGAMSAAIQGFNAQANWLNWILNQVGAQAAWAGWQMGQVGANAGRAASSVARLNSGTNGLQGAFNRAGTAASSANGQINSLGSSAVNVGGRFRVFATNVSNNMVLAAQSVRDWTNNILATLSRLPGRAAAYGRLSAFVSSIRSSMSQAESAVSSAVSRMLGQLHRLNTTVTARVNVQTQQVPSTNDIVPQSFPMMATFAAPAEVTFQPMAAEVADVESGGGSFTAWRRSADKQLREALRESVTRTDPAGNTYHVNVEAAPYVPTEKTIVTALSYADALYA